MDNQGIKTFRDLQAEVISRDLCGKCGGCVSFCSAGNLHALEMGEDDRPRYADEDKCLLCGICYMVCPVTTELNAELRERFGWRPPIGDYQAIRSARASYEHMFGEAVEQAGRWTFSTNGVSLAGLLGIPCVGFGPGKEKYAHSVDDQVEVAQLVKATAFYAAFPSFYMAHKVDRK